MAVVTTYAFDFVQNTDLTQGPSTSQADATSLANGGFAVSGTHVGHTDIDIFNGNLTDGGGSNVNTGTNSAIDQLANGNLVYVTQDADSIQFGIKNGTGGVVLAQADLGDTGSSNADVAALTGGNFVIVNQDFFGGTDNDIDVRVRNAAGGAVTTFAIDASGANDTNAAVCALDDGGFAVAWQRTIAADTEVWRAVFNSDGSVRSAATLFDSAGSINRNVDISAKSGGFVVVYEDNGWGTGTTDITVAEFSSAGTFQGFDNISNPTFINDGSDDQNATVTRLSNGLLVVGWEDNTFSDTDTIVALWDTATDTRLTTRNITAGESVVDDVGDITIAGSQQGRINVFHTNLTDADVDGETLVGRRTSVGDAAADVVVGDDFIDIITLNAGNDTGLGGNNNDTINGNDGDDFLAGGQGIDSVFGGNNNDTLFFDAGDATGAGEIIHGGSGSDRILVTGNVIFRDAVFTSIEEIEFTGVGPHFAQLAGAQLGGGLSNFLVIDGVNGQTDQVRIDLGADTAVNLTNWSFIDWVPGGPDGDRIRIFGDGDNENFIGSSVRDDIDGGDGANLINGNLGSDFLSGGAVGGGIDRFVFNTALGPTNVDRITDFEIDIDECRLENTIFTGLTNGNLNVNAFVIGAAAADATDRIVYNAANGALFFDVDGLGGVAQVRFATLDAGLALDNLDFIVT